MTTDNSEIQREHFNNIAEKYVSQRSTPSHLAYKAAMWDHVFDWIEQTVPDIDGGFGLDAMCGNAEVSQMILSRFDNVRMDAFDYSDEMVEHAQNRVGSAIRIFQQDILTLDIKDKYDFIVLVGGLHHVPDSVAPVLQNLSRALKPGGHFINLEPTHNNPAWKAARESIYRRNSLFEENTERGFDLPDYDRLLTGNGFRIVDQFFPGLLGYVFFYNPDAFPWLNLSLTRLALQLLEIRRTLEPHLGGTPLLVFYLDDCTGDTRLTWLVRFGPRFKFDQE